MVACGLELTAQLGAPAGALHLQQLFLLVQTVKMKKGKISTLLSAVLLELAPSCGNDYGKLAMTVNDMNAFTLLNE